MDKTDILERATGNKVLASDSNYYRLIFKKTEKIVCAVFYILRSDLHRNGHDDPIIKDLETTAQKVMKDTLHTLNIPVDRSEESVYSVGHALIELESKLRILSAARMLSTELLHVFVQEIDSVLRTLRNYTEQPDSNPLYGDIESVTSSSRQRTTRTERPQRMVTATSSASTVGAPTRSDRVVAVLKDKGQATIKDVSEVVTDCSEKTLQRELNSLIDKGVVLREGERRWSKYSLV